MNHSNVSCNHRHVILFTLVWIQIYTGYIFLLAEFIAECIKKRSPTSVTWRAVTRLSRHQQNCHAMRSGTLGKSHTNVISVTRLLSAMMISKDITAFTQVRHTCTIYTCNCTASNRYLYYHICWVHPVIKWGWQQHSLQVLDKLASLTHATREQWRALKIRDEPRIVAHWTCGLWPRLRWWSCTACHAAWYSVQWYSAMLSGNV